jgi:hypothetical protein
MVNEEDMVCVRKAAQPAHASQMAAIEAEAAATQAEVQFEGWLDADVNAFLQ